MQRSDILSQSGEESYVVLVRYDQRKMYFYDVKNNNCQSEKIDGRIPDSVCLPLDATMIDQVTVGGALKANVWLQPSSSGPANRYILSTFKNTPVNFFTKFDHDGAVSLLSACSEVSQYSRIVPRKLKPINCLIMCSL